MPRPKSIRRISGVPAISGFKPYGLSEGLKRGESVFLLYEEYESLRLCDYEKYNQQDASSLMGVSRPTFTRIYMSAREKIALAMVEGRKIRIEGGKVVLDNEWMHCEACGCFFSKLDDMDVVSECALCGSREIASVKRDNLSFMSEEDRSEVNCGRGGCRRRKEHRRCCEADKK